VRPALRPFRPEDLQVLLEIDKACYPPDIAYSRRELAEYMQFPGADCLLAETAGAVVAFLLTSHRGSEGHIITIDVLEPYRRTGVGSLMLEAAEKRLAERGVTLAVLETAINNYSAISFWEKHGYRTRGILKNYYPGPLDAYAMTKSLRSSRQRSKGPQSKS
jgi:ribosomal-protein-alanine N-acetyltransferase